MIVAQEALEESISVLIQTPENRTNSNLSVSVELQIGDASQVVLQPVANYSTVNRKAKIHALYVTVNEHDLFFAGICFKISWKLDELWRSIQRRRKFLHEIKKIPSKSYQLSSFMKNLERLVIRFSFFFISENDKLMTYWTRYIILHAFSSRQVRHHSMYPPQISYSTSF